jgi:hypothetical protein
MQPFATICCPYCGEYIDIAVDVLTEGQSYVEDCQVCCRPIVVTITLDDEGEPSASVMREDDA